jgi:RNA polymerase sigma factor for flagellar operon FliA
MERIMRDVSPADEGGSPFVPPPSYQELAGEAALWQRWVDGRDHAARDILARHYQAYARALAAQMYSRHSGDEFEFDEYLQFATVGMLESLDRFDPTRGAMFKTFATRRITGAILSGLASLSERQEQIVLRRRVADERSASLKGEQLLDDDPESLLRELANIGVGLALGYILDGTGMMENAEQTLPDNTYTRVELKQFQDRITHLVRNLTAREQDVVRLHYFQSKSFDEVAEELGLTKGRVSQLHKQALLRLRTLIADRAGISLDL